jgi:hypothetical protein
MGVYHSKSIVRSYSYEVDPSKLFVVPGAQYIKDHLTERKPELSFVFIELRCVEISAISTKMYVPRRAYKRHLHSTYRCARFIRLRRHIRDYADDKLSPFVNELIECDSVKGGRFSAIKADNRKLCTA